MEQCLGDQQFVTLLLYLNDICIFAPTIDKMLDRIELVFDRLKQFNLKIKPKKCQFFDTSVLFLGHILSAKGISANPEKVEKVRTWPVPRNIKEVQSFLGLASYYRRFIDKFAEKARCLHKLVGPTSNKHRKARAKKEATTVTQTEPRIFEWTMKHQEAFDALKEALSTAPVLGYPDFSREFILGDRCFFERTRCHPITTGQGRANPCDSICEPLIVPLRKINAQLQLSKTRAASTEVGSYRKIQILFVGLAIPSVHGQQPTCLCHGKQIGSITNSVA